MSKSNELKNEEITRRHRLRGECIYTAKELLELKMCENCGHDINMHRFLKKVKPTACMIVMNKRDLNSRCYCPCSKFVAQEKK